MRLGDRVVFAWQAHAGELGAVVRVYFVRKRDEWAEPRGGRGWRRGYDWIEYDFPIVDVRLGSGRVIEGVSPSELAAASSRHGLIARLRRDRERASCTDDDLRDRRSSGDHGRIARARRSAKSQRKSSR